MLLVLSLGSLGRATAQASEPTVSGLDTAKPLGGTPAVESGPSNANFVGAPGAGNGSDVKAFAQCLVASKKAGIQAGKELGLPLGDPAAQAAVALAEAEALSACKDQVGAAGGGGQIQTMAVDRCASENPECTSADKLLCNRNRVAGIMLAQFDVQSGAALQVYTDSLAPSATADTVLYLLKCDTSSCTNGQIVGIDDDGNTATPSATDPWDSRIEIPLPAAGKYMAIAIAFSEGREGFGSLHARQFNTDIVAMSNQPVGGWRLTCKEFRTGDALYVAKDPAGPGQGSDPDYHDSVVAALSTTSTIHCAGSCGAFQFGDDTYYGGSAHTYQTRLPIAASLGNPTSGRIIIAPFHATALLRPRFMHVRRHITAGGAWTEDAQLDRDGDSLTHELEQELKTCDVPPDWVPSQNDPLESGTDVGIVGQNCASFRSLINKWVENEYGAICPADSRCWHASDSDHDGISDSYEVFAAPIQCAHTPSGPYRDAGLCTQLAVDGACAAGTWCMVEPLPVRAGADSATQIGPDPRTFDIYVDQDYYQPSAANTAFSEPAGQHRLNATQFAFLRSVFGTTPLKCWDGTAPAGVCPNRDDWRYKVALHVLYGAGTSVGDDRFQEELPMSAGATFARSHWFARFGTGTTVGPAFRYGGLGRYSLAWHGSAGLGASDGFGNRLSLCGDQTTAVAGTPGVPGAGNFSHELGHQLTLYHPHGPGLNCVAGVSVPADTTCKFDAPPSASGRTCSTVLSAQTPVASIMSYEFLLGQGMLPLGAAAPSASLASMQGCVRDNLRFSKGLNPEIYEGSLQEGNVAGAPTPDWKLRKLSQDLFCFDGFNDGVGNVGQYSFYSTPAGTERVGPGWDGSRYTFNWNGNTTTGPESGQYFYDISGGKTDPGISSTSCDTDTLRDVNEWGRVFALSQGYLQWAPPHSMCLYGDTFNGQTNPAGGLFSDFCGWGEVIETQNMVASTVTYPRGACVESPFGPIGCGGAQPCLIDYCETGGGGCRGGASCDTSTHACGCTTDGQCFSGQCVAGMCLNTWGSCACGPTTTCPVGVCSLDGACPSSVGSEAAFSAYPLLGSEPYAFLESAEFNGTNARIRLPTGANSRLESMSGAYENGFEIQFDFRHDGFDAENEQVVFSSGAFNAVKRRTGLTESLDFQVGNQTVLSYPPRNGSALQRGRWYRIVWSAKPGANGTAGNHFVWVRPWDVQNGGYEAGNSALNCARLPISGSLAAPGDVWLGFDGGNDANRYFKGRLDNVSILNYVYRAQPANCTLQQ